MIEDKVEKISIEIDCMRLMEEFCFYLDQQMHEEIALLFLEDGEWIPTNGELIKGRSAISESIRSRPATTIRRHVLSGKIVNIVDKDRAIGFSKLLAFHDRNWDGNLPGKMGIPDIFADVKDQFRRVDGVWKIERRESFKILSV